MHPLHYQGSMIYLNTREKSEQEDVKGELGLKLQSSFLSLGLFFYKVERIPVSWYIEVYAIL